MRSQSAEDKTNLRTADRLLSECFEWLNRLERENPEIGHQRSPSSELVILRLAVENFIRRDEPICRHP